MRRRLAGNVFDRVPAIHDGQNKVANLSVAIKLRRVLAALLSQPNGGNRHAKEGGLFELRGNFSGRPAHSGGPTPEVIVVDQITAQIHVDLIINCKHNRVLPREEGLTKNSFSLGWGIR